MTTAVDKWPAAARLVAVAAAGHLPTAPTPPPGARSAPIRRICNIAKSESVFIVLISSICEYPKLGRRDIVGVAMLIYFGFLGVGRPVLIVPVHNHRGRSMVEMPNHLAFVQRHPLSRRTTKAIATDWIGPLLLFQLG